MLTEFQNNWLFLKSLDFFKTHSHLYQHVTSVQILLFYHDIQLRRTTVFCKLNWITQCKCVQCNIVKNVHSGTYYSKLKQKILQKFTKKKECQTGVVMDQLQLPFLILLWHLMGEDSREVENEAEKLSLPRNGGWRESTLFFVFFFFVFVAQHSTIFLFDNVLN